MCLFPTLSSTAMPDSPNFRPIRTFMLSFHLFLCLPLLLDLFTTLCRVVFAKLVALEIRPSHGKEIVVLANCILDLVTNLLISHNVFVSDIEKPSIASHLMGLDSSFQFWFQDPAFTYI